jgi:hypothetical protein
MNPRELNVSSHFTYDRKERLHEINWVLLNNWGISIKKSWEPEKRRWRHLTNTGLFVVTNEAETDIITMFIPSVSQARQVFNDNGVKMPYDFYCLVKKNLALSDEYYLTYFEKTA